MNLFRDELLQVLGSVTKLISEKCFKCAEMTIRQETNNRIPLVALCMTMIPIAEDPRFRVEGAVATSGFYVNQCRASSSN